MRRLQVLQDQRVFKMVVERGDVRLLQPLVQKSNEHTFLDLLLLLVVVHLHRLDLLRNF